MEDTNKYKITNYLNSGTDLVFTLDATTNVITPVGGYQSSATAWYFYNNDTEKSLSHATLPDLRFPSIRSTCI